jgi:hypothetical protein
VEAHGTAVSSPAPPRYTRQGPCAMRRLMGRQDDCKRAEGRCAIRNKARERSRSSICRSPPLLGRCTQSIDGQRLHPVRQPSLWARKACTRRTKASVMCPAFTQAPQASEHGRAEWGAGRPLGHPVGDNQPPDFISPCCHLGDSWDGLVLRRNKR